MATSLISRLLAPAVLAAGLGLAALAPAPARAGDDDLVRVVVSVADVIYHGGYPYYRHGPGYGYGDRLIVVRDHYHRPTYYRYAPRRVVYHAPPRGNAYGYYRDRRPVYVDRPVYVRYVDRDRHYYRNDRHDRWDNDDDKRWKKHDKRRGGHRRDD